MMRFSFRLTSLAVVLCAILTSVASLSSCVSTPKEEPFVQASPPLQAEIDRLVSDLQFVHGEELLKSNQRLIYIGEPAIPALLKALGNPDSKTRSNVAYVLGEIRDRRAVSRLRPLLEDADLSVRYEVAASLLVLGDWNSAMPVLFQGLRDPDKWNRYKTYSVLKEATKQDFGYDWQASNLEREEAVKRYEDWWARGGNGDRGHTSGVSQ